MNNFSQVDFCVSGQTSPTMSRDAAFIWRLKCFVHGSMFGWTDLYTVYKKLRDATRRHHAVSPYVIMSSATYRTAGARHWTPRRPASHPKYYSVNNNVTVTTQLAATTSTRLAIIVTTCCHCVADFTHPNVMVCTRHDVRSFTQLNTLDSTLTTPSSPECCYLCQSRS